MSPEYVTPTRSPALSRASPFEHPGEFFGMSVRVPCRSFAAAVSSGKAHRCVFCSSHHSFHVCGCSPWWQSLPPPIACPVR